MSNAITVNGVTVAVRISKTHRLYAEVVEGIRERLTMGKNRGVVHGFKWWKALGEAFTPQAD